jgi:signal transduction histidine kinase
MSEPILTELLAALDVIVIEKKEDGTFPVIGEVPAWFSWFYAEAVTPLANIRFELTSPFLENFLIDADQFWSNPQLGRLNSGSWEEKGPSGGEDHLEASALSLNGRKILLIGLLGVAHDERRRLLQIAREKALLQHQLLKEIQKKEILLHCVAHDLVGLLMGVKVSFSLLDSEPLSETGKDYLQMGQRQYVQQERLISDIVQAFSAEMESLGAFKLDPATAPDLLKCLKHGMSEMALTASVSKVNIDLAPEVNLEQSWKVVGEKQRLQQVILNLLENAVRVSPPFSTVKVKLHTEDNYHIFSIGDEGPGIPSELVSTVFQKFAQTKSGKFGFGLYFCRIMVERWGGSIGYNPQTPHGSQFWLRLPRLVNH